MPVCLDSSSSNRHRSQRHQNVLPGGVLEGEGHEARIHGAAEGGRGQVLCSGSDGREHVSSAFIRQTFIRQTSAELLRSAAGLPATPRAARRIKIKPETKGIMSGSAPPLTRLAQRRVLTAEMHGQCDRRLLVMSRFRKAARPLPSLPGVPGAPALPPAVSRIPPLPPPSSCSFPDSSELPLTFTCPQLQGPSRLLQKCPLLLSTCEQECSQTGRGEGGDLSSILSLDC